ncbi:MAG: antitoxin family protein [Candidatus Sumerlaeota bacterium]|nr:antitoxin family protein [Candidatus Sumerlaeota bacterium]
MTQTIHAVYQHGVFSPLEAVDLPEGKNVTLLCQIETPEEKDIIELAGHVYDGLSANDVNEIEKIALDRDHFLMRP